MNDSLKFITDITTRDVSVHPFKIGSSWIYLTHWDLKVANSQAKIDENFANYFLETKAINKCFRVQKTEYIKS